MRYRKSVKILLAALIFCSMTTMSLNAAALEDTLVIITSYSKDVTLPIKAGFEKKYPAVKVEILNKKTSAGVKYIQEISQNNTADIFWASAPDAFEVLKTNGLLQKYKPLAKGIPDKIGAFPINDPQGYYLGFAASGYGIMYNTRYLKAKKLPPAKEWRDLANAVYHDHVAMSAPSRSGTTHLTVETILQGEGWQAGWALMKAIGGNFAIVTERSFGVPDGVNNGQFGLGIVIDFFGFSSKATGFPVEFVYPKLTTLVPANIAIVKHAPHINAAAAYIEFLLSPEGQEILLDPKIRRLPINPSIYAKAPKDFPNPFQDASIGAAVKFDVALSGGRYNLVNSLFDQMITFRLEDLKAATRALQKAEAAMEGKFNPEAARRIEAARALIAAVPITESQANDPGFSGIFKKKRTKITDVVPKRQAEVEEEWDRFSKKNYAEARAEAQKAFNLLK